MALDSRNKRGSAIGEIGIAYPNPDGTVGLADRLQSVGLYSGIAAGTGAPATEYYPNSVSCGAWKGRDADSPPDALADMQDTAYSDPAELNKVSADDANYVDSPTVDGNYLGHQVLFTIDDYADAVTFTPAFKVGDITSGSIDFYLWMWNYDTTTFDQIDMQSNGPPASTVTLTGIVAAADYVNASGEVQCVVHSANPGELCRNWYDVLNVSYGGEFKVRVFMLN